MTALIWGALPQPRSDRRKDRVETNPEQLTAASVEAEISFFLYIVLIRCHIVYFLNHSSVDFNIYWVKVLPKYAKHKA